MILKTKICKNPYCKCSYVEDPTCNKGYCQECSKHQNLSLIKPKHSLTHRKWKKIKK